MEFLINEDNFYLLFALIFIVGNLLFMYYFYYTIMNSMNFFPSEINQK